MSSLYNCIIFHLPLAHYGAMMKRPRTVEHNSPFILWSCFGIFFHEPKTMELPKYDRCGKMPGITFVNSFIAQCSYSRLLSILNGIIVAFYRIFCIFDSLLWNFEVKANSLRISTTEFASRSYFDRTHINVKKIVWAPIFLFVIFIHPKRQLNSTVFISSNFVSLVICGNFC